MKKVCKYFQFKQFLSSEKQWIFKELLHQEHQSSRNSLRPSRENIECLFFFCGRFCLPDTNGPGSNPYISNTVDILVSFSEDSEFAGFRIFEPDAELYFLFKFSNRSYKCSLLF